MPGGSQGPGYLPRVRDSASRKSPVVWEWGAQAARGRPPSPLGEELFINRKISFFRGHKEGGKRGGVRTVACIRWHVVGSAFSHVAPRSLEKCGACLRVRWLPVCGGGGRCAECT